MSTARFYFTVHPGDLSRQRLLEGAHLLLVASAHWDAERKRFKVRRPPADHIASIAVDSGGFTAAKRWGRYPWTHEQYIDFIRAVSRDVQLDFCAVMDYACEREVNRETFATNRARIKATIHNDACLRQLAPDLPWLSVLQGNTLDERAYDLRLRRFTNLLPAGYAGIGSICGRTAGEARKVIRFYADNLPGVRYHAFGLHIQTLDADDVYAYVASWDSYCWNWPSGAKGEDRAQELLRQEEETYSTFCRRLASHYYAKSVEPRLSRPRQLVSEVA